MWIISFLSFSQLEICMFSLDVPLSSSWNCVVYAQYPDTCYNILKMSVVCDDSAINHQWSTIPISFSAVGNLVNKFPRFDAITHSCGGYVNDGIVLFIFQWRQVLLIQSFIYSSIHISYFSSIHTYHQFLFTDQCRTRMSHIDIHKCNNRRSRRVFQFHSLNVHIECTI